MLATATKVNTNGFASVDLLELDHNTQIAAMAYKKS